jgi:hypothetical protein
MISFDILVKASKPGSEWTVKCTTSRTRAASLTAILEQVIYGTGGTGDIKPAQEFKFVSLGTEDKNQTFYLGAHFEPKPGSREHFQYYYRFGGLTNDERNLAVDVDADRRAWRILLLSGHDDINQWLAQLSRSPIGPEKSRLPQAPKLTETLIRNGTFNYSDTIHKYILIPELDFMIGNVVDFVQRCEYEPFIRVFNAHGLNGIERDFMGNLPWVSRSGDRVIVRGASFGYGRRRLDICLREGPIHPQAEGHTDKNAVADELMVPLAIISALRHRVWESSGRKFKCWRESK